MVSFNADLFARDVRVGRAMLALDLREMAKETGVSFPTIHRLERGLMPSVTNVTRLIWYFGFNFEDYIVELVE